MAEERKSVPGKEAGGFDPSDLPESCHVTGFSRSIPFFIGSLPFIVFLGEDAWNTVDISREKMSLSLVISITCPSLLSFSLYFHPWQPACNRTVRCRVLP
jgi:hypothetical protein